MTETTKQSVWVLYERVQGHGRWEGIRDIFNGLPSKEVLSSFVRVESEKEQVASSIQRYGAGAYDDVYLSEYDSEEYNDSVYLFLKEYPVKDSQTGELSE